MRLVTVVVALLVGALLGAPMADAAKKRVYRTPGYKGIKKVPRTVPPRVPAPLQIGAGAQPDLHVDLAGTAHIVWNEDRASDADVVHYCRLPRGATTCNQQHSLVPEAPLGGPGTEPIYSDSIGSPPRILQIGEDLVLFSFRYPQAVEHPPFCGVTCYSSSTLYLWVSDDGGDTFTGPGIVSKRPPNGSATVFGPRDSERIALISDTVTGGTFFQALEPGTYEEQFANLGEDGPDRAYYGSVAALSDGRVAAAFAGLDRTTYYREWTGQGSPNNSGNWTAPLTLPGDEPRITSGQNGTFLISRPVPYEPYELRRVDAGGFGPPLRITNAEAAFRDIFEDPGGNLHVAWKDSRSGRTPRVVVRSAPGSGTFAPVESVAEDQDAFPPLELEAARDGGGFVVWESGSDIHAGRFGPGGPTGERGAGGLPGGQIEGSASCTTVKFRAVVALARSGCWLSVVGRPSAKVSAGPVRINGLDFVPLGGARIVVDRRERTIDVVGGSGVSVKLGDIELWRGGLNLRIDGRAGTLLASFPASAARSTVKGFPIAGRMDIALTGGGGSSARAAQDGGAGVRIPIAVKLPKAFGDIRGEGVLVGTNGRGLHLESLVIEVDYVAIGPLVLEELRIEYASDGEVWTGHTRLSFPPHPVGAVVSADVRFDMGNFTRGGAELTFPAPGTPLGPGIFLTQIRFSLELEPNTQVGGGATITAGPNARNIGIVQVDGDFTFRFRPGPVLYDQRGALSIGGIPLAENRFTMSADGFAQYSGRLALDVGLARLSGDMLGFIDGRSASFGGSLRGEVCVVFPTPVGDLCLDEEGVVSSKGFAACIAATVLGKRISGGYGLHWGDNPYDPGNVLIPCDTGPYRELPPVAARAAQAGAPFTVPSGAPTATVRATGQGGAPALRLTAPNGEVIETGDGPEETTSTAGALIIRSAAASTTWVVLDRPRSGGWSVALKPGSAPLATIASSVGERALRISGRVSGRGRTRTLRYRASGVGSRTVRLVEQGKGVYHELGTARARGGRLRFTPAEGGSRKRAVLALVERDGLAIDRRRLASFRAPAPRKPGRVRALRARRKGGGLLVTWRGAGRHVVSVSLDHGRRLQLPVRGRRVRIPRVPRYAGAGVSGRGVTATGRTGPARRLRVKPAARLRA